MSSRARDFFRAFQTRQQHNGTAHDTTDQSTDLRRLLPPCHAIPLGFMLDSTGINERWIYYNHERQKSLITIAPNRSGKTLTQLAYELGIYGGRINDVAPSVVVNDKKGELLAICGRARHEIGDKVYKVDPLGVVKNPLPFVQDASINILEGLTPDDTTDLFNIASGLLVMQGNDPHWVERPRQLVACLLAHLLDDNEEPANLPYIMEILRLPREAFQAYMQNLAENSPVEFVRQLAGSFTGDTREDRAFVSSAMGQLGFLADKNFARVLRGEGTTFKWSDLKRGGISVFFCLPEKLAATASRFSRLFWTSAINSNYELPAHPVLMVIDEASSSLGATSDLFETAFALGGGFGLRLHLLFQNLPQLNELFKDRAESIMSSAGVTQWFQPNDMTSAEYIQKRTGDMTYVVPKKNYTLTHSSGINHEGKENISFGENTSFSTDYVKAPRVTVQQLFELPRYLQILFLDGIGAPALAYRKPYPQSQWATRFDDNPFERKGR